MPRPEGSTLTKAEVKKQRDELRKTLAWPPCESCKSTNTTGTGKPPGKCTARCKDCKHSWPVCGGIRPKLKRLCGGRPMENGRCHLCGGESPGAPLKHGQKSKWRSLLPKWLQDGYDIAAGDPEITSLLENIRIKKARLAHILQQIRDGVDRDTQRQLWKQYDRIESELKHLADTENRRIAQEQKNLNERQAQALTLNLIAANIQALEDAKRDAVKRGISPEDFAWLVIQIRTAIHRELVRYLSEADGRSHSAEG